MNKLEEKKHELSKDYIDNLQPAQEEPKTPNDWSVQDYEKGFDAAIALNLPVKYARWKDSIFRGFISSRNQPKQWTKMQELFNKIGNPYSEKSLYKYWIDNIYKPE